MSKNVTFYFKGGIEEKVETICINDIPLPRTEERYETVHLAEGKNRITLLFKGGERFSAALPGGKWDRIIVNEIRVSKPVLLGGAAVCLLVFLLDVLVWKSEDIRFPALPVALVLIWNYFYFRKNKYRLLFR